MEKLRRFSIENWKKDTEKMFLEWMQEILKLRMDTEEKSCVTPQDFDCWIAGYITGLSAGNHYITKEVAKEIIDYMVASESAKLCGVTGTLYEKLQSKEVKHD